MRLSHSSLLKPLLALLHHSGLASAIGPWTRGKGLIFTLHHVLPHFEQDFAPNRILSITPEFLDAVIVDVRRAGFDIVSLDEAHARATGAVSSARPFAAFTFDDGYRDNPRYAYPVLKRRDAPFTVYVPTDFPDGHGELWWLVLEEIIRRSRRLTFTLEGAGVDLDCDGTAAKWRAFDQAYWTLRHADEALARQAVRRLAERVGIDVGETCRSLIMPWDEIRSLAADPLVTIGAHTRRHFALAKLDDGTAREEMAASQARLVAELGQPCEHFSFPYGDAGSAGPREFRIAEELGFKTAVTTRKGVIGAAQCTALTALPRVSLNGDYQDLRYVRTFMSGVPFAMLDAAQWLRRPWQQTAMGRPSLAAAPSTR